MNLIKLFDTQRILDARIEKEHPRVEGENRLAKKILALQVELGELANEWRGFKFWSSNQQPCTSRSQHDFFSDKVIREYNPLLEEYVDCLHFILSIGLELELTTETVENYHHHNPLNVTDTFRQVFRSVATPTNMESWYEEVFAWFIDLGEKLGFTWEQIEEAYYEKNEINHERQNTGY